MGYFGVRCDGAIGRRRAAEGLVAYLLEVDGWDGSWRVVERQMMAIREGGGRLV